MKTKRFLAILTTVVLLMTALTASAQQPRDYNTLTAPVAPQPGPDWQYFPETGHNLRGDFLFYWRDRGGLAQFGYPVTEPFSEEGLWVQYFERVRMELHPNNPKEHRVLLGHLGKERLYARYHCGEPQLMRHDPVVGQAWQPGPADSWRVIMFWTNEPNHDQGERKLLLAPHEIPWFRGGGSLVAWPSECAQAARDHYESIQKTTVTLTDLYREDLAR